VSHDDSRQRACETAHRIFLMQVAGSWIAASTFLLAIMASVTTDSRFADLQFRVLIIGRANAGKTTILQRVCNTTESPMIYRNGKNIVST
jgi:hypothetical protein